MHKTLLGCVYSNSLFHPLTIHAQVCIILWDMPVLNYSVTHLYHSTAFNKHICTFIYKKKSIGLQEYYNSTSVSPFGEVGILLTSRQNLSDAFPDARPLLFEGIGCTPPVHLHAAFSVYFNGPWALSVMSRRKHSSIFLHKCIKQASSLYRPYA